MATCESRRRTAGRRCGSGQVGTANDAKVKGNPVRRFLTAFLSVAAAVPTACSHEIGPDDEPGGHSAEGFTRIRQQQVLMDDLTALAGGECDVDVLENAVRVRLLPGPRGLPNAATLRKMSDRITEVTGIPPRSQRMVTEKGRVLFANGAPAP